MRPEDALSHTSHTLEALKFANRMLIPEMERRGRPIGNPQVLTKEDLYGLWASIETLIYADRGETEFKHIPWSQPVTIEVDVPWSYTYVHHKERVFHKSIAGLMGLALLLIWASQGRGVPVVILLPGILALLGFGLASLVTLKDPAREERLHGVAHGYHTERISGDAVVEVTGFNLFPELRVPEEMAGKPLPFTQVQFVRFKRDETETTDG